MTFDNQVHADFDHARRKASWRNVINRLTGRRSELLRFEEVRRQLRAQGRHDAGARPVLLDAIVGSVGRYRDFDTAFLPLQTQTKRRWLSIDRAHYDDLILPPVELYQLGEVYFVKDGNHRVSVARERGQVYVDAVVIELHAPVPIGSLAELEDWIGQQDAVEFLSKTQLLVLRPAAQVLQLSACRVEIDRLVRHAANRAEHARSERRQRDGGGDDAAESDRRSVEKAAA